MNIALRNPKEIMNLASMGASHATSLSFMQRLIRTMAKEKWEFTQSKFNIDNQGYGYAIYQVNTLKNIYSLIAFSHQIEDSHRSDRVIAEKWDATYCLYDGVLNNEEITRLSKNVPLQENGRFTTKELVLSRSNKSVRFFSYLIDTLSKGKQPKMQKVLETGYIMRTSAVYGSGKFGCADYEKIKNRNEFKIAFQAELLTVYLIRNFTFDLVEFLATQKGKHKATQLKQEIKQFLGIGNSTGLGMAPFMIKHSILINNWVLAKETALAKVRSQREVSKASLVKFKKSLKLAQKHMLQWNVVDEVQSNKINILNYELKQIIDQFKILTQKNKFIWNELYLLSNNYYSLETRELIVSLLIEQYPEELNKLSNLMIDDNNEYNIKAKMKVKKLKLLIEKYYDFALDNKKQILNDCSRFWYYSEEKLEPRLGDKKIKHTKEQEMPLNILPQIFKLYSIIKKEKQNISIAYFLFKYPKFRDCIIRIQNIQTYPYSEIYDNVIGKSMRPIDLLRFKLSFFGASKFDPKSDLWLRITMFQGAPLISQLKNYNNKNWLFCPAPIDIE